MCVYHLESTIYSLYLLLLTTKLQNQQLPNRDSFYRNISKKFAFNIVFFPYALRRFVAIMTLTREANQRQTTIETTGKKKKKTKTSTRNRNHLSANELTDIHNSITYIQYIYIYNITLSLHEAPSGAPRSNDDYMIEK